MTDEQKGWLLMGVGALGYVVVWLLIGKSFSFMYGIPAVPLVWGRTLTTTKPEERRARPLFKVLGLLLLLLFLLMIVLVTITEVKARL